MPVLWAPFEVVLIEANTVLYIYSRSTIHDCRSLAAQRAQFVLRAAANEKISIRKRLVVTALEGSIHLRPKGRSDFLPPPDYPGC